ncbi:MAG: oligosaccharide flippase family protein [Nanoarchaeota archaeon]
MSNIKKLFFQSSHFLYGRIFLLIASLISFPIMTRMLSVSDYGIFGLLMVIMFLIVALSKSGLQNSYIRFYDEYKHIKKRLDIYYSTFFYCSIIISILIAVIYFLTVNLVLKSFLEHRLKDLLSFVSLIILFKSLYILFTSFFRAAQRTGLYNLIFVLETYFNIFLGIIFLLLFKKNLYGLLIGYLLGDVIVLLIMVFLIIRDYGKYIKIKQINSALLKEALVYGLPLMGNEFTNNLLIFGDRFVISILLNSVSLGFYTAASNLANNVSACLAVPISYAIVPIYMNLWVTKGKDETQKFLSQSLAYSCLISFPVIFIFTAIGKDVLVIFASSKYQDAYSLIPYLSSAAIIFYGITNIVNAGLLIFKKGFLLMFLALGACVFNFILSYILVKILGVNGAALATLITCVTLIIVTSFLSFKFLDFEIKFLSIGKYFGYSILMFLSIFKINLNNSLMSLILKTVAGTIVYLIIILLFEKDLRRKLTFYLYIPSKKVVRKIFCLEIFFGGKTC